MPRMERAGFRKSVNMTEGNLFWNMIRFALPVMATTMMQLLYVTIDLTTVHYGDSAESMGAIASNNALINLIIVVFTGVSLGVNVLMSEARGAKNPEKAEKVMHTSLLFALFSGIFVGVVGFFLSDNLLEAMGTEAHWFEKAALYLRIYFCGLPFLMIYNYTAQLLRAQGNSQTPFVILAISGAINVGFDCLFVFPLKMGVAGVGVATVISEGVSCVLGVLALAKSKNAFVRFSFKKLHIDRAILFEVLRVGLPSGLQGFFFSLPNVFIQSSLYTIDPGNVDLENGATAAANVEGYFFTIIDSIGTSAMTFIAANMGAKKKKNILKCALFGFIWGMIGSGLVLVVMLTAHRPLLSLFVDNDAALAAGYERLFIMSTTYALNMTMALTANILKGIKKAVFPMITTMVFCTAMRILLIYTLFPLEQFHTLTWLYALFPITWTLATISNGIFIAIVLPKTLKKLDEKPVELIEETPIPEES